MLVDAAVDATAMMEVEAAVDAGAADIEAVAVGTRHDTGPDAAAAVGQKADEAPSHDATAPDTGVGNLLAALLEADPTGDSVKALRR